MSHPLQPLILFSFPLDNLLVRNWTNSLFASGFSGAAMVKNQSTNAGDARDTGLIPGLGRSPGVGIGNLLQYSCLENSMDRKAWLATVHGVPKSWTRLSVHTHAHTHIHTLSHHFTFHSLFNTVPSASHWDSPHQGLHLVPGSRM